MTAEQFRDAVAALALPEGAVFSAGLTYWVHQEPGARDYDYNASVHVGSSMIAHVSGLTSGEEALADLRRQLAPSDVGQAPVEAAAGAPQRASVAQEDMPF